MCDKCKGKSMTGALEPSGATGWKVGRVRPIREIRLPVIPYPSSEFNSTELLVYWGDAPKVMESAFDFLHNVVLTVNISGSE